MNKLICTLAVVLLLSGMPSDGFSQDVRVHGRIDGLGGERVELCDRDRNVIAAAAVNGDLFELTAQVPTGDGRFYYLYVPSLGQWGNLQHRPTLSFIIDSQDVGIEAAAHPDEHWLELKKVSGSPMHERFYTIFDSTPLEDELGVALEEYNKYFQLYNITEGGKTEENRKLLSAAGDAMDSLFAAKRNYFLENICSHSTDIAYAAVIWETFSGEPYERLEAIYGQFDPSIRECYPLEQMARRMASIRSSEVGRTAPDFTLTDLDGKTVRLSSLRGKYVLIDFWASWCGPCLREIPNIISIYEDYKDRGDLQVVGVSIDQNEGEWRDKVAEKGLEYLQLFDPEGTTTRLYNFQGIPFLLLISPKGVILERGIRGEKIREAVEKHVG